MKENLWSVLLAVALVAAMLLYMITYTVPQGSQGVVLRFGRFLEDVQIEPGLNLKWPAPIDRVVIRDTRVQVLSVIGKPVSTKDENIIIPSIAVGWRVTDLKKYLQRVRNDREAEASISDRVDDARSRVANTFPLAEIISPDPKQPEAYRNLESRLLDEVRRSVKQSDYGIEIVTLQITGLALPEPSTEKVNERMIAERDRRSQQTVTEGENEAQRIRNQANLERQKAISQAMADARRMRGEGDARAAEHYRIFKENPSLATFLMHLETMKAILNEKTTVTLPVDRPLEALIGEPPLDAGKEHADE